MNLSEKIENLNWIAGKTLCITHYASWSLESFGNDSVFSTKGPIGHVRGKTIDECVNNAVELARQKGYHV